MAVMGRVIHVRIHGLAPAQHEALCLRFDELAAAREWRGDRPWLADAQSHDLFSSLFYDDVRRVAALECPDLPPLSAAGFVRLKGDETDALALLFMLRRCQAVDAEVDDTAHATHSTSVSPPCPPPLRRGSSGTLPARAVG